MANKYLRTIYGVDKEGNAGSLQVDVYDILDAYPTKNPALDHLIKKALCPGQRGHKDLLTDLDDIIKSAQRAKAMIVNKMACTTEVTLSMERRAVSLADQCITSVEDGPGVRGESSEEECIAVILDDTKDVMASARDVDPVSPTKTSEGYDFSFSDRPESFDNAVIYVVEGVDPAALERLESEAGPCDTVIEYVRRAQDCPKGAIVIYDDLSKTPLVGDYWYHAIDKAIRILVNDQKKIATGPCAGRPASFKGQKTIYAFPEKIRGLMPKLIEAVNGVCGLEYIEHIDDALAGSAVVGNYPLHEPMVDGRFTYGLAEALEILANDKKKDDTNA